MIKKTADHYILLTIAYLFVGALALLALTPFVILAINSFASEKAIITHGYSFWPGDWSLDSYEMIFGNPQKIAHTYLITIIVTACGTLLSLLFTSMCAYVLSRKELRYRGALAFFLYFTQLFNGGLVPFYLLVSRDLHLSNNIMVLILVPMFSVMNILIMRNYMKNSIPDSIIESATIDGVDEFGVYWRMVLPLSGPVLASIGLFTALGYWNDWWTPMMFVQKAELHPLQYTLYQMLSSVNFSAQMVNNMPTIDMPKETLKLAMTVVATGPIVAAYPFVQRHFVSGITMGAVKG